MAVLFAGALVPSAAAAAAAGERAAGAARECTSLWRAVERVPVRRPAWNEGPIATSLSPVDHYLRRGQVVRSCTVAVARTEGGPAYRACGGEGNTYRIVPGGQVPQACLRRV
ncbi:hypothetical protein [Streptomyces fuscichromogenes]|uniref:Uncharacterized protein n=1 Tax=Streptomyces fuscichromogenes TaxID=1324013 RepID=A0A917XMB4_9ACTN|nr:hypothetical protein [Streptomyces fuscichromogenes]GGN40860.1 hypothetical protein GCM10011578_088530 [Streptomyces fuscichromogenes]